MPTQSSSDFPANPLEKAGYRLEFNDEFDASTLDTTKWYPYYLPHWSSRSLSAPAYFFEQSNLVLQILKDQQPWCPEFDGAVRCSSIQTGEFAGPPGSSSGQHRFNPACVVREAQTSVQTYTPQYGYFEARARALDASANLVALWMIGYEDAPERSGEIAIFEIFGAHVEPSSCKVGYGVHPWGDPDLTDEFYQDHFAFDATTYHVYALEWTPTHLDFYVDNRKTRTIHQSPNYPMQFMLSLYELPRTDDTIAHDDRHTPYPKTFVVDYVRAYQPVGGY